MQKYRNSHRSDSHRGKEDGAEGSHDVEKGRAREFTFELLDVTRKRA